MNTIQRLLQKLIPDKINIYKETIDGLTGQVIAPKYYLSVEDYYKINETINDLICAINFVIDNSNIDFTNETTLNNSIQNVITSCPIITAINGLSTVGIRNYNVLTSFYLNGKKYQYNLINQGNLNVDYNFVSGNISDFVTSINHVVDNVDGNIKFNENNITGGISGIQINNRVYYPFSTYYWNSTLTTLPASTFINNQKFSNPINIQGIRVSGLCNGVLLYETTLLSSRELKIFRIDAINDKNLMSYTSAYFDGELVLLTKAIPLLIDENLKIRVKQGLEEDAEEKEYQINGNIELYTKGVTREYNWNSSIEILPSFTSTTINGEVVLITNFNSEAVTNMVCSGYYTHNIMILGILTQVNSIISSNTPITTFFNGKVDLGNYYNKSNNYIASINNKTKKLMFLLSGIKYKGDLYLVVPNPSNPDDPKYSIRINISSEGYIVKDANNILKCDNIPLTLKSGDFNNENSAITKLQLDNLERNEFIKIIDVINNTVILDSLWYPLHAYDNENKYVKNGILSITTITEEETENTFNRVVLKDLNITKLSIMKVSKASL